MSTSLATERLAVIEKQEQIGKGQRCVTGVSSSPCHTKDSIMIALPPKDVELSSYL
jgi:hypothetical protein